MHTPDVMTALRPTLPDVEALFEAFTQETGSTDPVDFVEHLHQGGKLTDEALVAIEQLSRASSGTLAGAKLGEDEALSGPTIRPAPPPPKQKLLDDDEPAHTSDPTVFYRGHDPAPDAQPVLPAAAVAPDAPPAPPEAPTADAGVAAPEAEAAPATPAADAQPEPDTLFPVESRPTPITESEDDGGATGPQTGVPKRQLRRSSASGEAGAVRGPMPGPPPVPSGVRTANPTNAQKKELLRAPSFPGIPAETEASTGGAPRDVPGRGYQFVGKIGEGAMGEILIAKDRDLHRTVAYKVMGQACAENPALSGKFYSEAQITAQLDHPNIVPIYALDRSRNGTLSYTMKMIRGRTYEKFIHQTADFYKAKKPVPEEHSLVTRLEMFLRVCDAMHYAHIRGVIHRDLKPENIMIGAYGEVYVMDWGIAKLWEPSDAKREDLVLVEGYEDDIAPESDDPDEEKDPNQGVIIGTPQYMSPEQAHGRRDIDPRSDQYALGLILYEVVSLAQAVTGKSPIKIVMRQQDGDKNPLKHIGGEKIPPELEGIILKSTQKDPQHRYTSVRELAEDIRRYLRGEAVIARPDTPRQRIQRWVGKHRELTLFLMFVFFTLSGLTVFISVAAQIYLSAVAREREQQVTNRISEAAAQAALIDSEFARYEGILGIVQASAVEMLLRGEPSKQREFFAADFAKDPPEVPGLVESKHYNKMKISVMEPLVGLPANASESSRFELSKLQPLQRYLKRSLLLSKNEAAAAYTPKRAEKLIADTGVPLAWVTVGLVDGAFIHYPGTLGVGNKLEKYDVNKSPWYKAGEKRQEKTWGKPYTDPSGAGLMLPCATSLYDEDENFLGVAAVHLPLDYIIEELLVTEGLPDGVVAYLLNEDGQIVVDSTDKGKKKTSLRERDFIVPSVVTDIKNRDRGDAKRYTNPETGVREMATYNKMNSLGWYYAVRGPEAALLAPKP